MSDESKWRKRISQWEESDVTQAEFCRKHDLSHASFQYWRTKLGKPKSSFVEVASKRSSFELEFKSGAILRIPIETDAAALKRLAEALG